VCKAAGAYLLVDEAHSFGVYGKKGLGCAEEQGVLADIDFITGTFSKTLAGIGGYCVSNHDALKLLHFVTKPYVFTASGSPANIASVQAAIAVMQAEPARREQLWSNVRRVRAGLQRLGFKIGPTESPIVPIEIGTAEHAVGMWQALLAAGLYANIVLPPACKPDGCLVRTSYSAAHTADQVDRALAIFEQVGRAMGVIEPLHETSPH
jgi:8-amino-7-oxononanoate synthase